MTASRVGFAMRSTGPLLISLVIPVLNEEEAIPLFLERVTTMAASHGTVGDRPLTFEFVFVNDGSTDRTLDVLISHRADNSAVTIVDLSRNFGKEAALTAGIDAARGDAVVPIDVDLQDPPELVIEMVGRWLAGDDVVLARRVSRDEDSYLKWSTAQLFYRLHNSISRVKIPANVGDFRLMDRAVVDALRQLPERRRFMKGLFAWVGFKTSTLDYARERRRAGKTKFTGWRLWNLALDGLTSFSAAPLMVWTYFGFVVSLLAFIVMVIIIAQRLFFGLAIPGYAALSVAILFLGGVQLIGIGILGEYIGRVYVEVKGRPIYVVRKTYGNDP